MEKRTTDIGSLQGDILVFGGAYSNYAALTELHNIATSLQIPASNIINTGDVVGYCAEPEQCVQFIKDWGIHSIAGNVEISLRERASDCGCDFASGGRCDMMSKTWFPYAQQHVSEDSLQWMDTLPDFIQFQYGGYQVMVVHGSCQHTSEFIFKSSPWQQKEDNLQSANADVILAGHCGLPFTHVRQNKFWINAGAIGMPANDGTTRVWYAILNLDGKGQLVASHHSFNYDNRKTSEAMTLHNLPPAYAQTLFTGLWDNCEILPTTEASEQGKTISFTATY